MAIMLLPTKSVNEITALVRKFFWRKLDKHRFMSMIAWSKICMPWDEGGLGVRDITIFNEALIMKVVWQIASNSDRLWVAVVRAKYCARGDL